MMNGIERRLFEGNDIKGKSPVYSISDLENGFYRFALFHTSPNSTVYVWKYGKGMYRSCKMFAFFDDGMQNCRRSVQSASLRVAQHHASLEIGVSSSLQQETLTLCS